MASAAVLYSGGKDSTYSIQMLRQRGLETACLITMLSENRDSFMLHTASIDLTRLSSEALEIPIVYGRTKGIKEEELDDIASAIREAKRTYGFSVLGCGGISSTYQKTRMENIAKSCDLELEAPLWGMNQFSYMESLPRLGYHVIMTSVSAAGLDDSWLGRELGEVEVQELISRAKKYGFNPALEGGEGETFVIDCPLYLRNRIRITDSTILWDGYRGILQIKNAKLEPKLARQRTVIAQT